MSIKSLFLCCVFSFPLHAFAAADPVSFEFQSVSIVNVLQLTYKNVLHRDYVISPAVLALDKKMSLSVKALPVESLPSFVEGLLSAEGISVVKGADDIYFVSLAAVPLDKSAAASLGTGPLPSDSAKLPSERKLPDTVRLYRPDNRTVDFMVTVLNAAFGRPVARVAGQFVAIAAGKNDIDSVFELAASVDLLPRSVEVSASFVEVSTSAASSSGLSLASKVLNAQVGAVAGTGNSGSISLGSGSFQLVLDALVADGRFKQVSNSRVVGDESERVSLSVGDETPTVQSSGMDNSGNAVQNIVYRSSGVILDVLPKVLGGGRLSLTVDGQVSSFKATTTGVTGSPTLSKRQVKTALTLGDGDVLIIGGLEQNATTSDASGFSFLPVSWRGVTASASRSDLLLVLSARIVSPVAGGGRSPLPVVLR